LIAVVVALWGVAAVTAVMEEGIHQSRQDTKHLVDVSEGEPKSYVVAMASATVRVSGKEGGVGNLRRGDVVGILYTETEGERIAKMVLVTDTEER
jgi:hypothetical protein